LFDWWYRFRRVAKPPGTPATRAAVPADIAAVRAAELAPVFAHVDRLEPELLAREAAAEHEAASISADAERAAELVVDDSRVRVAAVRADAAATHRQEYDAHAQALRHSAGIEAIELRRRGDEMVGALVADAVARVRAFARSPVDEPAPLEG